MDEWQILIDYLGGAEIAGGKLKEDGTLHWNSPNTGATDESGFCALPAGSHCPMGRFDFPYFGTSASFVCITTAGGNPDDSFIITVWAMLLQNFTYRPFINTSITQFVVLGLVAPEKLFPLVTKLQLSDAIVTTAILCRQLPVHHSDRSFNLLLA